jgi:DNA-binding NarL/FixJ family response regulator
MTILDAYLARGEASSEATPSFNHVTDRERELLQLLAEGRNNKAIIPSSSRRLR